MKKIGEMTLDELSRYTQELIHKTQRQVKDAQKAVKAAEEALDQVDWTAVVAGKILNAKVLIVPEES